MLNGTKVGTAMRALADNRENTALLGVPVRRVESVAWFGSGIVFGVSGLLLASLVGDGDRRAHVHASRSPPWRRR